MVGREIAARRQRANESLRAAAERLVQLLELAPPDLAFSLAARRADPALAELAELERVTAIAEQAVLKIATEQRKASHNAEDRPARPDRRPAA